MSYILDALKRADAERERGVVPGLYARQVTSSTGKSVTPARSSVWLALVLILTLGAVAGGVVLWRSSAETPRQALPEPTVARPTPATPLPPSAIQVTSIAPARTMPASAPLPLPLSKPPTSAAPTTAPPLLADLSEDIRRQIPALNISGAVYSENPGQRLLLVNNLVLNQGSQAAPEISLEEIGAKSSVFNFRGTRFRLTH
jgi:general secretion pathway protein B